MAIERREVVFHGQVQGVGFRYAACRAARGYEVTGFVRNMPDGTVQCVIEGQPAEIDLFLVELSRQMSEYIKRTDRTTSPATGQYRTFDVKF